MFIKNQQINYVQASESTSSSLSGTQQSLQKKAFKARLILKKMICEKRFWKNV